MPDIKVVEVGTQGPQGPTGPTGPQGATGPTGPQGPPGETLPENFDLAEDGFLTLHGDARMSKIVTYACENWYVTHHAPLEIKALADPGYVSSTLTTQPDANRRIRIYGAGEGIHEKGEQGSGWSAGDTTHDGVMSRVSLATKNASWEQATPWRLVLNISVGKVTGQITIYLPSFKMDKYEMLHFWITDDGASYYGSSGECRFEHWAAGASKATEDLTSNVTAGDSIVCLVGDTTSFYVGDKVQVEDYSNAEWDRITAIILNTSVTINHLAHSYTTAANAKITKVNCVQSPYGVRNMRRGMGRICCFKENVPSGVAAHYAFPFSQDPNSPLKVALVFCGIIDNPTFETVRIRLQYVPTGPGDNAFSKNYGEMQYITVIPGAKAGDFVETLFTGGFEVPANEILNKKAIQLQIVRTGDDVINDTYEGCLLLVAAIIGMTEKQLGADQRM